MQHSFKTLLALLSILLYAAPGLAQDPPVTRISEDEYRDKVHAAWLGQIVGNIYGLSYEFVFIDTAGPDDFPYGYGAALERVEEAGGAFSDDDTDIEYMYLLQMERHGIEPTYAQLAAAWKHHVRERVWIANRAALMLMHAGYGPPLTGDKRYNPHWFQIDPQLVNEIWAATAPGMIDYATAKSAWAANITNDDFGIEPTVHYAAMYSAAFFESDIHKLIDIGTAALPDGSRFAATVEHMKQLHQQYPEDWRRAREEMASHYYGTFDYNRLGWPPADANLNGAAGILALLYGSGDFQRTLDVASGMGFDADNQAATMSGLLGIIGGVAGIPEDLLYPLGRDVWDKPFNDVYKNVSRHDLPDASIIDIAERTASLGMDVIIANGGRSYEEDGRTILEINTDARFRAPFELTAAPVLIAETGKPFTFDFFPDQPQAARLSGGTMPPGLTLNAGSITGTPSHAGLFEFTISATSGDLSAAHDYVIRVHGKNLAVEAMAILHSSPGRADSLEVLRDGDARGETFYSARDAEERELVYYGYAWDEPQSISTLIFNPGLPQEFGGWFTSLDVEYLDPQGDWRAVDRLNIDPAIDLDNTQWLKGSYIDHSLTFKPVTTRAIRIKGLSGGIAPDGQGPEARRFYTSISELAVYME